MTQVTAEPIDPNEPINPDDPRFGQVVNQGGAPVPDMPGEPQYVDFWGVQETFRFMLKDGKQFFDVKPMDEGAKARFQRMTNKGIRVNQKSNDAMLDVDPAGERHTLIKESVIGWHIMQRDANSPGGWSEYPCPGQDNLRKRSLEMLLDKFNPKAVQELEFFIRTKNPWMQAEMDIEQIDEQIAELQTLRQQRLEEEQGESSSASK